MNIHLTGANQSTEVENWSPWSPSKTGLKIILCSVAAVQLFVCLLCLQICYSWKPDISWIFFLEKTFLSCNNSCKSYLIFHYNGIPHNYTGWKRVITGYNSHSENGFLLYQIVQWEMRSIYMLFIIQSKFSLHAFYLFFLLVCVNLFEGLCRLIIEYYKVTIADIKTRKMITSIFRIKNVFIDHKSCSSGFWSVPSIKSNELQLMLTYIINFYLHSDLPNSSIFSKDIIHFFWCNFIGKISNI